MVSSCYLVLKLRKTHRFFNILTEPCPWILPFLSYFAFSRTNPPSPRYRGWLQVTLHLFVILSVGTFAPKKKTITVNRVVNNFTPTDFSNYARNSREDVLDRPLLFREMWTIPVDSAAFRTITPSPDTFGARWIADVTAVHANAFVKVKTISWDSTRVLQWR